MIRFARQLLPLLGLLAAAGCASTRGPGLTPPPPGPYIRITRPDTNNVQLEVAVRSFVPEHGTGPALWLVGASHVGDTNYFNALQRFLETQTLVLFEGVGDGDHTMKERLHTRASQPQPPANDPGSLQTALATSLGLVFQLDAIDYDRANFQNSDLTIQDIQRLMQRGAPVPAATPGPLAPKGEGGGHSGGNESFDQLLQLMDGSSFLGSVVQLGLKFIGSSTKLQGMAKLAMIETLGAAGNDLADIKGLPPEMQDLLRVLIQERNQHVARDLQTALKTARRGQSIAVLYGAGHMADLERRVGDELHYRPATQRWFPAFTVDTKRAGLAQFEVDMIRGLVRSQLQMLQPAPAQ